MRRSLVAMLLSASFAFQLLLAGAGSMCVMPSGGANTAAVVMTGGTSDAGMPDMAMPGMPRNDGTPESSHGHAPNGAPCDQPGTPAACPVMAPCAGGFIAIASPTGAVPAEVPVGVVVSAATAPSSRTVPPEPPPPRA